MPTKVSLLDINLDQVSKVCISPCLVHVPSVFSKLAFCHSILVLYCLTFINVI